MAISDPRKFRPVPESGQAGYDAEEDPLVELARIVSEDSGFSGRRTERAQPRRPEPVGRGQSPSELEAELLRELESTFAAQSAPTPAPRPTPVASMRPAQAAPAQPAPQSQTPQPQRPQAAAPFDLSSAPSPRLEPAPVVPTPASAAAAERTPIEADPPEEPDSEELLRSIEEQLGQFERRARTVRANTVEEEFGQAFEASTREADSPEEWRPKRSRGDSAPDAARQLQPIRPRTAAEASVSDYRFRGPARDQVRAPAPPPEAREDDEIDFQLTAQPTPRGEPTTAPAHIRIEEPDEPVSRRVRRDPPAPVKFPTEARASLRDGGTAGAPTPVVSELTDVEAEISRELEPRYADPAFAGRRKQPASEEPRSASVAAAREQIGRGPARAPARKQRGGFRKALLTAASVLVVAALGAGAAVYLRSGEQVSSGPPPVIAAPEGAMKVEAPEQQATAETDVAGEAVYNRVAGNAPSTEERVVESAEEPREIARIVLPSSQAESDDPLVRQVGEGATATEPAATEPAALPDEIGPRRVQTFVVRPDGTVVATEEAGVRADPVPAQQQQLAAQTEQIEPVPVATVAIGDPPQDAASAAPVTAAAEPAPAPLAETPALDLQPTAPIEPAPIAAEPAEPDVAAVVAPPAEIPAPTASAGEGYVVQVSSQRSRDQADAAFADLQQRYGSVLGGLSGSVQEADLGEKGIYYRVRVGPWSNREEAVAVCEALQGAGGTCFVTQ